MSASGPSGPLVSNNKLEIHQTNVNYSALHEKLNRLVWFNAD